MATQIFFIFTPIWGFMIQFDEHIFQMGWWKTTNQTNDQWLHRNHLDFVTWVLKNLGDNIQLGFMILSFKINWMEWCLQTNWRFPAIDTQQSIRRLIKSVAFRSLSIPSRRLFHHLLLTRISALHSYMVLLKMFFCWCFRNCILEAADASFKEGRVFLATCTCGWEVPK